mgnify:FL=1
MDHGWTRLTEPMFIMRHDIHMTARFYDSMRNKSWNGLDCLACACDALYFNSESDLDANPPEFGS